MCYLIVLFTRAIQSFCFLITSGSIFVVLFAGSANAVTIDEKQVAAIQAFEKICLNTKLDANAILNEWNTIVPKAYGGKIRLQDGDVNELTAQYKNTHEISPPNLQDTDSDLDAFIIKNAIDAHPYIYSLGRNLNNDSYILNVRWDKRNNNPDECEMYSSFLQDLPHVVSDIKNYLHLDIANRFAKTRPITSEWIVVQDSDIKFQVEIELLIANNSDFKYPTGADSIYQLILRVQKIQ